MAEHPAYYVTARTSPGGGRVAVLLGPYPTRAAAEAEFDRGRALAVAADQFAWFYEFATAGGPPGVKTVFGV